MDRCIVPSEERLWPERTWVWKFSGITRPLSQRCAALTVHLSIIWTFRGCRVESGKRQIPPRRWSSRMMPTLTCCALPGSQGFNDVVKLDQSERKPHIRCVMLLLLMQIWGYDEILMGWATAGRMFNLFRWCEANPCRHNLLLKAPDWNVPAGVPALCL